MRYATWFTHLKMFLTPGLVSWIGLAAVVENFMSSLFNSHLFDFGEGWVYVLAVGVAGGMRGSSIGAESIEALGSCRSRDWRNSD